MDHTFDEFHPLHKRIRDVLNDNCFQIEARPRAMMIDDEAGDWLESELISTIQVRRNNGETVTLVIHEGYDKDPQYGAELAHCVMVGGDDWTALQNCIRHVVKG